MHLPRYGHFTLEAEALGVLSPLSKSLTIHVRSTTGVHLSPPTTPPPEGGSLGRTADTTVGVQAVCATLCILHDGLSRPVLPEGPLEENRSICEGSLFFCTQLKIGKICIL